jgi:hypothetical protein
MIRIENKTDTSAFISNECVLKGPDGVDGLEGVEIDGRHPFETLIDFSCDSYLAGTCSPPDCFGGGRYELRAHSTYEVTWSGHLFDMNSATVPRGCGPSSCLFPGCRRRLAAPPGEHTLTVHYALGDAASTQLDVKFTLPTTAVTATIAR